MNDVEESRALTTVIHPSQVVYLFDGNIDEVVGHVFLTMLQMPVRAAAPQNGLPAVRTTAIVEFSETWDGALALELSGEQAARLTELFIGADPADLAPEDIRDAVGEMANIIAGNIKFVLPVGIGMGMPNVFQGPAGAAGRQVLSCRNFESELGRFSVLLLEGT